MKRKKARPEFDGLEIQFKDDGTWLIIKGATHEAVVQLEALFFRTLGQDAFTEWSKAKRSALDSDGPLAGAPGAADYGHSKSQDKRLRLQGKLEPGAEKERG
jgi:hypothetical protein